MDREVSLLLRIIDQAFEAKAWHGPNLRGSIRGLTAAEAAWRPRPGRHNVWEIAVHAAYWKYAVRRRLTGEKRGSFALEGSNWFRRQERAGEKQWQADVRLLMNEHRALRSVIVRLRRTDLNRRPKGSRYDAATLIYGIASHDLYHAGQIQLLKRLRKNS
jgi:hypothetical protein